MSALTAGDDCEKFGLELQIATLDRAIDSLVSSLYGLSQQEEATIDGVHSSNPNEGGHDG